MMLNLNNLGSDIEVKFWRRTDCTHSSSKFSFSHVKFMFPFSSVQISKQLQNICLEAASVAIHFSATEIINL